MLSLDYSQLQEINIAALFKRTSTEMGRIPNGSNVSKLFLTLYLPTLACEVRSYANILRQTVYIIRLK